VLRAFALDDGARHFDVALTDVTNAIPPLVPLPRAALALGLVPGGSTDFHLVRVEETPAAR
jgi:hypothetical protein